MTNNRHSPHLARLPCHVWSTHSGVCKRCAGNFFGVFDKFCEAALPQKFCEQQPSLLAGAHSSAMSVTVHHESSSQVRTQSLARWGAKISTSRDDRVRRNSAGNATEDVFVSSKSCWPSKQRAVVNHSGASADKLEGVSCWSKCAHTQLSCNPALQSLPCAFRSPNTCASGTVSAGSLTPALRTHCWTFAGGSYGHSKSHLAECGLGAIGDLVSS